MPFSFQVYTTTLNLFSLPFMDGHRSIDLGVIYLSFQERLYNPKVNAAVSVHELREMDFTVSTKILFFQPLEKTKFFPTSSLKRRCPHTIVKKNVLAKRGDVQHVRWHYKGEVPCGWRHPLGCFSWFCVSKRRFALFSLLQRDECAYSITNSSFTRTSAPVS